MKCLRGAADFSRDRNHRLPLWWVPALVFENYSNCSFSNLWWISDWLWHDSILSNYGVSVKPGAVHNWRLIIKIALPLYEVKYRGEEHWEDISELGLMLKLYDSYDQVTPAIQQMNKGQEVQTLEAVYRLKHNVG